MSFTIEVPPVSKKNHSQIITNPKTQRPMLIPSNRKDIDSPVVITASFYVGRARRCDLSNFIQALADVLVHYGAIHDDSYNIIVGWDGSRMYVDRINPRTEVVITPSEERGYQLPLPRGCLEEDW